MTEEQFWSLIDENVEQGGEGDETDLSALQQVLRSLPPEEIASFDQIFGRLFDISYSWRLWGAAYLIGGGCSDDGFDYFRAGLIARGRSVFEGAIRDPDSLAALEATALECEEMIYVAREAFQTATGREAPDVSNERPDLGAGWDFDDSGEMQRRYPQLFDKYAAG